MNKIDFAPTPTGYRTSRNRVSIGVSLTNDRSARIRDLAQKAEVSVSEAIGRLIDEATVESIATTATPERVA